MGEIKEVLISEDVLFEREKGHTYNEIEKLETKALETYTNFLDFFFSMNSKIPFRDTFGIEKDAMEFSKTFLYEKAEDNLKMGIQTKIQELLGQSDEEIGETLFFYPLVGSLGSLAFELVNRER